MDKYEKKQEVVQIDRPAAAFSMVVGLCIALSVIGALALFYFDVTGYVSDSASAGYLGTLGDFIGGILNPIFAGAGLLLLLLTLKQNERALSQAEQMIEQGQAVIEQNAAELRASRDELEQSRKAQQELAEIEAKNLERNRIAARIKEANARLLYWNENADVLWKTKLKGVVMINNVPFHEISFSSIYNYVLEGRTVIFRIEAFMAVLGLLYKNQSMLQENDWQVKFVGHDYKKFYKLGDYRGHRRVGQIVQILQKVSVSPDILMADADLPFGDAILHIDSNKIEMDSFSWLATVLGVDTSAQTE